MIDLNKLEESRIKARMGNIEVTGRTVYELEHAGWRKGVEQFRNRYSFNFSPDGSGITSGELELMAAYTADLLGAAPELIALVKRQEAELAEARTVPESGMPVDMSQAKRWVTQLRARIESLLDVINEPSASLPAAGAVLTDERAAFEAAVNPVKDGYGGYSFDYMAQWAGWQARAILAAQPAAAAPDAQAEQKPQGCSGDQANCPNNEGYGCECTTCGNCPHAAQPEAKAAPAQAPLQANAGPSHGDMPVDRFIKAMPLPQYPSAAAPAMGEELPPQLALPEPTFMGNSSSGDGRWGYTSTQVTAHAEAYGRACMALRQPGASEVAALRKALADLRALHISTLRTQTHFNAYTDIIDKALAATAPVSQPAAQEPVAWLKEWDSAGHARKGMQRVDLTPDCEQWLANMFPRITPLYIAPQTITAPAGSEQEGGAA